MSFGFSPSDIVALVKLTTETYQGWKNACGEYADITSSLDGLCVLLGRIRDEANRPGSVLVRSSAEGKELRDVMRGCRKTVEELNAVVVKYKTLSSSRKKNWDRLRLGTKNLGELRTKLTQHTTSITVYLEAVGLGSLARIEDQLKAIPGEVKRSVDALAAEIRAGRREGSVMTTYEDDEKDVWRMFRRELVTADGVKSSTIHKYKPLIRQYLRKLAEDGMLEEEEPNDGNAGGHVMNGQHPQPVKEVDTETIGSQSEESGSSDIEDTAPGPNTHPTHSGLMYEDIHQGLEQTVPHISQLNRDDGRREMYQAGPEGFILYWKLPLRPSVAESHKLTGKADKQDRLLVAHSLHSVEIKRFFVWRKRQGRKAFLHRHIPWLPPREPEDRMSLSITLPPHWTYEIDASHRLRFCDHSIITDRGSDRPYLEHRLPSMVDQHRAIPPGWTRIQSRCRQIHCFHTASGMHLFHHPADEPYIQPGLQTRFDRIWMYTTVDDRTPNAPRIWQIINTFDFRTNDDGDGRAIYRKDSPLLRSAMSLEALFPELLLLPSLPQREVMQLEWSPELEQMNPGMREHLLEWQERMDNIASRHYETRHLMSWHDRASDEDCVQTTTRKDSLVPSAPTDRPFHTDQGYDHYDIGMPNGREHLNTFLPQHYQLSLGEHLWTLSLYHECNRLHDLSELQGMEKVSQEKFYEFAVDILRRLEILAGGTPLIYHEDHRSFQAQLAFACFFAPRQRSVPLITGTRDLRWGKRVLGPDDQYSIWQAISTYIRTLYGAVACLPGQYVVWRELKHCSARRDDCMAKCRVYSLQRRSLKPGKYNAHAQTNWLGHVVAH